MATFPWNGWQHWRGLGGNLRLEYALGAKIKHERITIGELPTLSVEILEITREHGRVTINDAVKATQASRNTIKDHIKTLHNNGLIERHGAGRGTWHSLA